MSNKSKIKKINMVIEESEEHIDIDDILISVDGELEKLQKLTSNSNINMSEILNLHNSINSNIEKASDKIESLKIDFNNIKQKPSKDIDSQTFEKYVKEINKYHDQINTNNDIEFLIKTYKSFVDKINTCETYLKSQQMNLIYCDSNDDTK